MAQSSRRTATLVFVVVIVVVGPWVKWATAQPQSRLALTAAIVDHGTVSLDRYEAATLGVDRVETDGELRSDKAPGQPVLGAPFYALARVAGADDAETPRIEENLTLWWVTFWTATVPLAAIAAMVLARARRFRPSAALPAALAITFSTFLLPYGAELYGHVLAAALGYGAWLLVAPRPDRRHPDRDAAFAGALAGAAVATEYPMVIVVLVVGIGLLAGRDLRRLAWFVAGGLPIAALLALYQNAAFGSPFRTSYSTKFSDRGGIPIGLPDPVQLLEVLAGAKGLIFTPIVFLAVYGAWRAWRSRWPERTDALVALIVFVLFVLLQSAWPNAYGGEPAGPRYVLPAMPFLGVPLAAVWSSRRVLATGLAAAGAVFMAMGLAGLNLVAEGDNYLAAMLENLDSPGVMPVVSSIAVGPAGWLLYGVAVAVAVTLLARAGREPPIAVTTPSGAARVGDP